MLEIKLKEEYDEWLRKIAREVSISPEELAYMSIEKFIKEYRTRKAVRAYVEGEISLGKAAEVAGMTKRKFMVMIEDFGISDRKNSLVKEDATNILCRSD
jgi:predicted HTH domain antitoxin